MNNHVPDSNIPLSGEFIIEKPQDKNTTSDEKNKEVETQKISSRVHSKPKFYSSLGYYPNGVVFQNQEADEEVVLLIRRDFITNVPWIIASLLLGALPAVIITFLPFFAPTLSISPILMTLAILSYYTMLAGFIIVNFAIWYFNTGIVTNKRIIDLDVPNILIKHLAEARLNSIADVAYSQIGGIRSFFDYGDVEVQTEAIKTNIEFDRAPNPNMIRRVIGELIVDRTST